MKYLTIILALCLGPALTPTVRAQNNTELQGDYAFSFNGMSTGDGVSSAIFTAVGRFTADGAGNLTNGEIDTNGANLNDKLVAQSFSGYYTIGADHRGTMNLNIPGGGILAFAMMANGNGKLVEVDASGGHGAIGSGVMEKVDTASYHTSAIAGDYAFGAAGVDGFNERTAMAGRFTANGGGTFNSGDVDVNQKGSFTAGIQVPMATYSVSDTTTGRGMITIPAVLGMPPQNVNFAFYMVNAGKFFAMEIDAVTQVTPVVNGVFLKQQTPLGGFSATSMNGNTVMYMTGNKMCPGTTVAAPDVVLGLISTNAIGNASLTYDRNCGGGPTTLGSLTGSYQVSPNGRVSFHLATEYIAAYLVSANQGFVIAPDNSVFLGFAEAQAAGSLTNSSVSGRYAGSATTPAALPVTIFTGEFTADGASPSGSLTGTEDIGAPSGARLGTAVSATYSVSGASPNGRGTLSGTIGGNGVMYVVSPAKFVVISLDDANPAVLIFEQ